MEHTRLPGRDSLLVLTSLLAVGVALLAGASRSDAHGEQGDCFDSAFDAMKHDLVSELFDDATSRTNHDYNDFGCKPADFPRSWFRPGSKSGYAGGHSGWDVQTTNVAGSGPRQTADEQFYSLTKGVVTFVDRTSQPQAFSHGNGNARNLGTIAVYTSEDHGGPPGGITIRYLHARHIYVTTGQGVDVGTRLGVQGGYRGDAKTDAQKKRALNSSDNEHVHIEVQEGKMDGADSAWGAGSSTLSRKSVEPISLLHGAWKIGQTLCGHGKFTITTEVKPGTYAGDVETAKKCYDADERVDWDAVSARGWEFSRWEAYRNGTRYTAGGSWRTSPNILVREVGHNWHLVAYFVRSSD